MGGREEPTCLTQGSMCWVVGIHLFQLAAEAWFNTTTLTCIIGHFLV